AVALVGGFNLGEEFLLVVGGRHAQGILGGAPPLYWPELWGTRALLYVWDDSAASAVTAALGNQAWRVREMATRVAAARALPVVEALTALLTDEVARVRASAARALGAVGEPSDVDSLRLLLKDPEIDVRRGAQQGLDALRSRHPLGDAPA
ncbi:MAG: HEAT repeat domain-containing protein, partial [Salinibacterium sp.]|nr:HEAT repeat domain-containing protein [Salinibacterium sp.]